MTSDFVGIFFFNFSVFGKLSSSKFYVARLLNFYIEFYVFVTGALLIRLITTRFVSKFSFRLTLSVLRRAFGTKITLLELACFKLD